jgi:hypothetical protein
MIDVYFELIKENVAHIEKLRAEIEYWERIYTKRIFELKWPDEIQALIDDLKTAIKIELEECKLYMKRIKEYKDACRA